MTQLTRLAAIDLPQGKKSIEQLENWLVEMIIEGEVDPLETDIKLAAAAKVIDGVRKNLHVKHAVMQAAHNYPEKTIDIYGAQVTKKHAPARYDYGACNDPVWDALEASLNRVTESKKAREKMLQTLTVPITIIDEETGDVVTVQPPAKEQGETIAIKFV